MGDTVCETDGDSGALDNRDTGATDVIAGATDVNPVAVGRFGIGGGTEWWAATAGGGGGGGGGPLDPLEPVVLAGMEDNRREVARSSNRADDKVDALATVRLDSATSVPDFRIGLSAAGGLDKVDRESKTGAVFGIIEDVEDVIPLLAMFFEILSPNEDFNFASALFAGINFPAPEAALPEVTGFDAASPSWTSGLMEIGLFCFDASAPMISPPLRLECFRSTDDRMNAGATQIKVLRRDTKDHFF